MSQHEGQVGPDGPARGTPYPGAARPGGSEPDTRFRGSVTAAFPLALLQAVRGYDRPGEILEDEDLTISMPRRLGLTGIVETQIFRYEAALEAGRSVPLGEAMGLFRLVMRRADAEPILRDTGQRVARWNFRRTPDLWRAILHRGPAALALSSARRAAVRVLRNLHAGSSISASKPLTIVVEDCVTAQLEGSGPACAMFTGMIEEQILLYTNQARHILHTRCLANGDTACEWTLPT